jgi:hypothetical protein
MPEIPYWIVPAIAAICLTVRHIGSEEASAYSKRFVCGLTAVSLLIPRLGPALSIPATLLQVAICVYILLHQTAGRAES